MSPSDRRQEPETQRDTHRPPGHPRPREAKSQKSQLQSEVAHGDSEDVKRHISAKLSVPGHGDRGNNEDKGPSELAGVVQQALDEDTNLGPYGLKVDVISGTVRVSGVVETLSEKKKIEGVVKAIPGVKGFEDGVSLSTDGSITDKGVEMEVAEEIANHPGLSKEVGVEVEKGVVHLHGRVKDASEEEAAIAAASRARGVIDVISHLKIGEDEELTPEELFHSQVRNDDSK